MKWGEYSNDVQFILQWNDNKGQALNKSKSGIASSPNIPTPLNITVASPEKHREVQKSFTFRLVFKTFGTVCVYRYCCSGSHYPSSDEVGTVKSLPQVKSPLIEVRDMQNSPHSSPKKSSQCGSDISDSPSQRVAPPYKDPPAPPPYRDPPPPTSSIHYEKYKKNILHVSRRC